MGVLVLYERFVPKHPLLPLTSLGKRTNIAVFVGTMIHGYINFGILYYLPLYFQVNLPPCVSNCDS